MPPIQNIESHLIFTLFLFVVPLLFLLFFYRTRKPNKKHFKIVLFLFFIAFIILNIRFNYNQRYPVTFTLQDKYEINLIIWEFPSFLDAPNFFHIGIKDLETDKKYFYKTDVIEGASFRFGVSKK